MIVEVDQSGKLERTSIPTVVSYSNSKSKAVIINSNEKRKLQEYFRSIEKRRVYIYQCFAILIFMLIKDEKDISKLTIDTEYPGQEPLIKNYLLNLLQTQTISKLTKSEIIFKSIGKKSHAHEIAYKTYRGELKCVATTAKEVLSYIQENKKSG